MTRLLENIGEEPIQRHTILFQDYEIILTLRFHPTCEMWCIDVEYLGSNIYGVKLSCGVLHMLSKNYPFDFVCTDNSGNGIDPFKRNDFSTNRCSLYMLESDDMQSIRGVPVSL